MSKIAKIIVSGVMALALIAGMSAPLFISAGDVYAVNGPRKPSGSSGTSTDTSTDTSSSTSGGGTSVSKAEEGVSKINSGSKTDLMGIIKLILNTVFVVIGILAVVFIIMGGINYTMSQGDPGKVKKAKDTILYGIIGLIVSLAAFAIVQFVLDSLK